MKKLIWLLLLLLLLSGCKDKPPNETTAPTGSTQDSLTETLPMDIFEPEISINQEIASTATVYVEEPTLSILDYGSFKGVFVEDGTDEKVEDVACMLVRNTTDQYLDYGVITADINGKENTFVVTGLPGGTTAWVLEQNRTPLGKGESFQYKDQTVSELRDDIRFEDERVQVELQKGSIRIKNLSDKTLGSVRVYYKQVHSDGNLLGGITYTTKSDAIEPGQTVEIPAGHSTEENCCVVRIDITE
ncbi:MAG: hypothetical protein J6K89_03355 [Oscillospiraceae bacterium]|nr:hypothetical protein [Oscillospiraceae bacterium]